MPEITTELIRQALRQVNDPELGIDVVSLGLIYNITIGSDQVTILMTLTTPGCPLLPYFETELVDAVRDATGISNVKIEITFDPPWHPGRISPDAKAQLQMLRA